MKTICVIPARFASSRLPGKPLALIGDKPMIQWVYEKASQVESINKVLVATDHTDVLNAVKGFDGKAVLTAPDLPSGTDRVHAAIKNEDVDVVVNLQGDEPFVSPALLADLVSVFKDQQIEIATPICRIDKESELNSPHVVKVVRDLKGFALYFSRSQIPFFRDVKNKGNILNEHIFYKHIGIYAYRKKCLEKLTKLKESSLEQIERLEQLRFIENGYKIFTIVTDYNSVSVDTSEDLQKVNEMLNNQTNHHI